MTWWDPPPTHQRILRLHLLTHSLSHKSIVRAPTPKLRSLRLSSVRSGRCESRRNSLKSVSGLLASASCCKWLKNSSPDTCSIMLSWHISMGGAGNWRMSCDSAMNAVDANLEPQRTKLGEACVRSCTLALAPLHQRMVCGTSTQTLQILDTSWVQMLANGLANEWQWTCA